MPNWLRDGLALVLIAALLALLSIPTGENAGRFLRGAGILFGIGGIVVILIGLVRQRQADG